MIDGLIGRGCGRGRPPAPSSATASKGVDGRLRSDFPRSFIESLYPRVRGRRRAAGDDAGAVDEALSKEDLEEELA